MSFAVLFDECGTKAEDFFSSQFSISIFMYALPKDFLGSLLKQIQAIAENGTKHGEQSK